MPTVRFASCALEGRVVRLEPLTEAHWPGVLAIGLEPAIWRWTIDNVSSEADLRGWFDAALEAQSTGAAVVFATVDRATGRVAGSTRFGNLDEENRRAEIGWTWLGVPWQRTATNTEAKYLMLCHAFEQWGLVRVELKTDALNEASRRAIRRIGAKEEGIFRRYQVSQGGRMRDTAWYAVTDLDWPEVLLHLKDLLNQRAVSR
jgi:RimJ/RimL family protein N-acetyltransferase